MPQPTVPARIHPSLTVSQGREHHPELNPVLCECPARVCAQRTRDDLLKRPLRWPFPREGGPVRNGLLAVTQRGGRPGVRGWDLAPGPPAGLQGGAAFWTHRVRPPTRT